GRNWLKISAVAVDNGSAVYPHYETGQSAMNALWPVSFSRTDRAAVGNEGNHRFGGNHRCRDRTERYRPSSWKIHRADIGKETTIHREVKAAPTSATQVGCFLMRASNVTVRYPHPGTPPGRVLE